MLQKDSRKMQDGATHLKKYKNHFLKLFFWNVKIFKNRIRESILQTILHKSLHIDHCPKSNPCEVTAVLKIKMLKKRVFLWFLAISIWQTWFFSLVNIFTGKLVQFPISLSLTTFQLDVWAYRYKLITLLITENIVFFSL